MTRNGPVFRVLMKHDDVPEVPEPSKNVKVVAAPKPDEDVLAALDPDGGV